MIPVDAERQAARELAPAIAEALGDGWTYAPGAEDWQTRIQHESGLGLFLRPAGHTLADRGKITVSPAWNLPGDARAWDFLVWDHEADARETLPDGINVSASKAPAVIARDIMRRLAPAALEMRARLLERVAQRDEATSNRDAVGRELAGIVGGAYDAEGFREGRVSLPTSIPGWGHVEVQHGGGAVSLELRSVPVETARRMLAVLREGEGK